jgi:hypothetical protein
MNKLIGVILALVMSLPAEAASPFDPSSSFSSRAEYCGIVQARAAGLYVHVNTLAGSYRTTFADVIRHNVVNVLSLVGYPVDPVDASGMLFHLSLWDTGIREGQAKQRAAGIPENQIFRQSDEELSRRFAEMIGQHCNSNTLRFAAPGYCPAGEGCSSIGK